METIDICYLLHDPAGHYTKFLGTSMLSVLEHASGTVRVHVLLDATVAAENRARLQQVADAYGQELVFHEMETLFQRPLRRLLLVRPDIAHAVYTVASFYRLFLPMLCEGKRVICLDADTVVTCDVRDVFSLPVGSSGISVRREAAPASNLHPSSREVVDPARYFNSGVMLLDFAVMQAGGSGAAVTQSWFDFITSHPREKYHDQDVLNHFFSRTYVELPSFAHMLVPDRQRQGIQETPPGIYHFDAKSLGMFRPDDVYDQLFYEYFSMTPWCDGAFLLRAFSAIRDAAPQRIPEAYGAQLIGQL